MNVQTILSELKSERKQAKKTVARLDRAIRLFKTFGTGSDGRRTRRRMSAAARRRIGLAQKARWRKNRKPGATQEG